MSEKEKNNEEEVKKNILYLSSLMYKLDHNDEHQHDIEEITEALKFSIERLIDLLPKYKRIKVGDKFGDKTVTKEEYGGLFYCSCICGSLNNEFTLIENDNGDVESSYCKRYEEQQKLCECKKRDIIVDTSPCHERAF